MQVTSSEAKGLLVPQGGLCSMQTDGVFSLCQVAGHFTVSEIKYDSYMNNFNIKQT
jgi:hypothetical protein